MSTNQSKISKRRVGAIVAAAATFAIVSASAATLGGLDIESLGADSSTVVAPVTEGVTLSFDTEYAVGGYVVKHITLEANGEDGIPADAEVKVTLADEAGVLLAEYTLENGTFETEDGSVRAHEVGNASVVINGAVVKAKVN